MGFRVLLSILVLCGTAQGYSLYLSSWSGWSFYNVMATGPMTNANVKATCEAAGMGYPCCGRGNDFGGSYYWAPGCITHSADEISNLILRILSAHLCTTYTAQLCPALHDTFVYCPNWSTDDSAIGVDVVTVSQEVPGASLSDKFALCAKPSSCSSSPCVHGTCEDHETYYSCHDNCDHQPYYVCRCEPGWFGDRCHIYIDECQSSPCPQNATCVDHVNGYTCQCPPGFTGDSCQTDINWCAPNPCPSDWVCVDMLDAFQCQMPAGRAFSGDLCTAASCGPGWNCNEDGPSGYTCFRG
ncbi:uncharacterized protein LOC144861870 [Branchiostoma floridae x Branchiostoma japonicum]